ncbi:MULTISPECIES: DUF975 family protein [Streptococcus]|uniref:Membrane protein n=2 Tax=Streptococcus TaxID=1301 RepID=A0ABS2PSH6_9STRE|nr:MULTISPECIES: DUF975 family protein [Streptococcus]MBM7635492.1 putative membrane protein [Streptococcus saliviloxodontae]MBM7642878.1 putative membrane protein [Streptococcus loxodontisalivarius]
MNRKELKQTAKQLLKSLDGKYQLFLIPILLTLFSGGLSIQQAFMDDKVVSATAFPWVIQLILAFFSVSASITMLDVVRFKKRQVEMADSTRTFSTLWFKKLIFLFIVRFLMITLWSLPIGIGMLLVVLNVPSTSTITNQEVWLILIGVILYLVGLVLSIIKTYSYSQAEFVLYDLLEAGQNQSSLKILKESTRLMKGQKFKLFALEFSFIGWYLLIPFTLGLIFIYLLPYLYTSRALFYNQLPKTQDTSQ